MKVSSNKDKLAYSLIHLTLNIESETVWLSTMDFRLAGSNLTNDTRTNRECQNFPGNKIPGQKISRQNIPGWKILGPENSRNTYFSWNSRNFLWENSRIFFFRGQKIPGFLAPLISRIENSVTEFPRTFLAIFWLFWAKQDKTPPGEFGGEFGFPLLYKVWDRGWVS